MLDDVDRVALDGSETPSPIGQPAGDPDPGEVFTVSVYLVDAPGARSPQDVGEYFSRRYGLKIESTDDASRRVQISGTVRELERAFGVKLQQRTFERTRFVTYEGSIRIDADVAPSIMAVLGLDRRPIARPRTGT
jgi:hypothetical protein